MDTVYDIPVRLIPVNKLISVEFCQLRQNRVTIDGKSLIAIILMNQWLSLMTSLLMVQNMSSI